MAPIPLLSKLQLLEAANTVLDIGTKDGNIASKLAALGKQVTAIDINEPEQPIPAITFKKISVEDFVTENKTHFDIAIARHVFPFIEDQLAVIKEVAATTDVFFFTCFGPKDAWRDRDHITTTEKGAIDALFRPETIRHYSETLEYSPTYAGDVKFWHIHTYVIDTRV